MNKNYTWDESTQFTLNGKEFEALYNSLRVYTTSPLTTPSVIVALDACFKMLKNKLEEAEKLGMVQVKASPLDVSSATDTANGEVKS